LKICVLGAGALRGPGHIIVGIETERVRAVADAFNRVE
jgi:hypothetical protein